jgi:hypothetical protein
LELAEQQLAPVEVLDLLDKIVHLETSLQTEVAQDMEPLELLQVPIMMEAMEVQAEVAMELALAMAMEE